MRMDRPEQAALECLVAEIACCLEDRSGVREVLQKARGGAGRDAVYQRLEFLGDRVLGVIIASWLYARYPREGEGVLALRFVELVRRETLADVSRRLGLDTWIDGTPSGAGASDRQLADCLEALIGQLFQDGGLQAARSFVERTWEPMFEAGEILPGGGQSLKDPKTRLQEYALGRGWSLPTYRVVRRVGPDHDPHFHVEAMLADGSPKARGEGRSVRAAEREAAARLHSLLTRPAGASAE